MSLNIPSPSQFPQEPPKISGTWQQLFRGAVLTCLGAMSGGCGEAASKWSSNAAVVTPASEVDAERTLSAKRIRCTASTSFIAEPEREFDIGFAADGMLPVVTLHHNGSARELPVVGTSAPDAQGTVFRSVRVTKPEGGWKPADNGEYMAVAEYTTVDGVVKKHTLSTFVVRIPEQVQPAGTNRLLRCSTSANECRLFLCVRAAAGGEVDARLLLNTRLVLRSKDGQETAVQWEPTLSLMNAPEITISAKSTYVKPGEYAVVMGGNTLADIRVP